MSSSKNHFLMIDEIKMRSKKDAEFSKRKNDKTIANDSSLNQSKRHDRESQLCDKSVEVLT
jgi:hypothetical protein